ncbi:Anaphase-promoting complex subunit 8 [Nymphaea thermarum]|nr:Anaphase-promoting complex subunit 8 [Nymphaea thermarum]
MTKMSTSSRDTYRNELRIAVRQLRDRCLYSAAKWAAEQLIGLEPDNGKSTPLQHRSHRGSSSIRRRFRGTDVFSTPSTSMSYVGTPVLVEEEIENDYYLLAKAYFDSREYRRAAHVLRDQTGKKAMFLRGYALYLAGEKRKEEEMIELEGPFGKGTTINCELGGLEQELCMHRKKGSIDPFGLYLYGVVLRDRGCDDLARAVLVESVNGYPWNWNAWSELQSLCTSIDILNNVNVNIKNHWMKDFFFASAYLELKIYGEALKKYELLQGNFSLSDYVQAQIATAQYSLSEFDEAHAIFDDLLKNDPYRVDTMDVYSNVLYAKESCSALSCLAHRVISTDKYRPESCCIIGNYYSLKGLHEKAVIYFRRALRLNRKYLSAWTLMGHEYVEMKNPAAAVDAYRRAVDINVRDYRAWYGLGQTYELMAMPFYALYYYRKSAYLQPTDARMWVALAQCYESGQLNMLDEAIKCYKRAANYNEREGIALSKLAELHDKLGRRDQAAMYYKLDLERMDEEQREGPNVIRALSFLAEHCQSQNKHEEAQIYCTRLLDYTSTEKETARNIMGMKTSQSGFPSMEVDQFMP